MTEESGCRQLAIGFNPAEIEGLCTDCVHKFECRVGSSKFDAEAMVGSFLNGLSSKSGNLLSYIPFQPFQKFLFGQPAFFALRLRNPGWFGTLRPKQFRDNNLKSLVFVILNLNCKETEPGILI